MQAWARRHLPPTGPIRSIFRTKPLATVKLHYDGWLALPAGLRQSLYLRSGDRLEAKLVDGTIVLRPAKKTRAPAKPAQAVEAAPVASASAPAATTVVPAKRPRGRPRKVRAIEDQPELMPGMAESSLPAPKRKPGRPRKVRAEEIGPVAGPGSARTGESGLWKLRPKAELPVASPDPEPILPPPRRPEPSPAAGSHEREERRPFRNVEVRKLGAGRRQKRLQRVMNPTGAG
jgi:bifunctional DNA-binding transcriptional regulator/antitoxin component of YhaV-PrlF toxin-antitoxin module